VKWRRRKGSGKRMVFEEVVNLEGRATHALRPTLDSFDEREYGLIAETYQQLKKNYDDKKDYWTAGDFHYGEMEMKRLATRQAGFILRVLFGRILGGREVNRLRRWSHQRLGLVALYKYASQYGESFARPFLWLVGILLLFGALYPIPGLRYDPDRDAQVVKTEAAAKTPVAKVLTYGDPYFDGEEKGNLRRARLRVFRYGCMTALEIAAFQKEPLFTPTPTGRLLALAEALLTSTLIALFLLAVRRQFRR
jgi:hypothetical protein